MRFDVALFDEQKPSEEVVPTIVLPSMAGCQHPSTGKL